MVGKFDIFSIHRGQARYIVPDESRRLSSQLKNKLQVPEEKCQVIRSYINEGSPEIDHRRIACEIEVEEISGCFFRVGYLFFVGAETYFRIAGESALWQNLGANVSLVTQASLTRINNGEKTAYTTFAVILRMLSIAGDPRIMGLVPTETLFLDCGAGKGFLSLVAYKLWGFNLLLVENSQKEQQEARLNLALNGLVEGRNFVFPCSQFGLQHREAIIDQVPSAIRNLVVGSNILPASIPLQYRRMYDGTDNNHSWDLARGICNTKSGIKLAAVIENDIVDDYEWCPPAIPS